MADIAGVLFFVISQAQALNWRRMIGHFRDKKERRSLARLSFLI
jgi:hypothetical protein